MNHFPDHLSHGGRKLECVQLLKDICCFNQQSGVDSDSSPRAGDSGAGAGSEEGSESTPGTGDSVAGAGSDVGSDSSPGAGNCVAGAGSEEGSDSPPVTGDSVIGAGSGEECVFLLDRY